MTARSVSIRDADIAERFERDGFIVLDSVVDEAVCDALIDQIEKQHATGPGSRSLLRDARVASVAHAVRAHPAMAALLPVDAVAVQCTLFSKSRHSNWSVGPHQDLSIPVARKLEAEACGGWSVKEDGWHVQPPKAVLDTLVAVRLQLDVDSQDAGCLRVVAGSHRRGRIPAGELPAIVDGVRWTPCAVQKSGALAMRPLVVHASSKAAHGVARRVLHFLFGPRRLPLGLEWAVAV